jgi:6-phosphogluconolactonase
MDIERLDSAVALTRFVTDRIFKQAQSSINANNVFNLAVSGGSTPLTIFKHLAERKHELTRWHAVNFFWVDERWVPYDHPESNYGQALRSGLNVIPACYHPFNTQLETAEESCRQYNAMLESVVGNNRGLDMVILGGGEDGHTASVFREDVNRAMCGSQTLVTRHPVTGQVRVSLSLTAIAGSKDVLMLLTGEEKREVLSSMIQFSQPVTAVQWMVTLCRRFTLITDLHE